MSDAESHAPHEPYEGGPYDDEVRPRRRIGPVRIVLAVVVLVLLAWIVAVAVSGVQAARALQRVADSASLLEEDVRAERFGEAQPVAQQIADDAKEAAESTSQWPYRAATKLPWVGAQLTAVQGGAQAAALLTEPLPNALSVAEGVLGQGLVSADQTVNVAGLQQLTPIVLDYQERVPQARSFLAAGADASVISAISSRLDPVSAQLDSLADPLATAASVFPQLPAMLGADGARTYLVAFTNPAEIRPVQGIVGAYAYLTVDAGHIQLAATGSDNDLYATRTDVSILGQEYLTNYGTDAARVQNLTLGAQADDAGRLTAQMFVDTGLPAADAVVFVDPVGLGQLLGPDHAPLDLGPFGSVATAGLADVLMYQAYVTFGEDQDARKAFLTATSAAAFEAVLSDGLSTDALDGGQAAVSSGHLAVWSARPEEQAALVAAGVAGLLGDPAETGTTVKIGMTNSAPSKLDYWMRPEIDVSQPCVTDTGDATSRITMTLTNNVPDYIPNYMRNQLGDDDNLRERTAQDVISLWVPPWVGLDAASVNGAPVSTAIGEEHGWRLIRLTVDVVPYTPVVISWQLRGEAQNLPRDVTGPTTAAAPSVTISSCSP